MAFRFKRFLVIVAVIVVAIFLTISFTGLFSTESQGLIISSAAFLEGDSIRVGDNASLTIVLDNRASEPKAFELHFVYSGNMTFYDGVTGELLSNISQDGIYYNLTYPVDGALDSGGGTSIPVLVEGWDPIGDSQTYTIFLKVYLLEEGERVLSDDDSVRLTVNR